MIYFDNAATTFPKPHSVIKAVNNAVKVYSGNPGRAGHKLSINTAEAVFTAREKCADFFGADSENTIFTLNCTHALNFAIKGMARQNAHYIISDLEHNAVSRPVHSLSKNDGITYSVAKTYADDDSTVKSFEALFRTHTRAVVCTMASNVTGQILPYKRLAELCKRKGVCFIVDAAQGAGVLDIKVGDGINFICCSGHKGLYGPMGTGLLISDGKYTLETIIEGGTGSNSNSLEQPLILPERFESGTINTPCAISLGAGIDFVNKNGLSRIYSHEKELCDLFVAEAKKLGNIKLYAPTLDGTGATTPIVPFNIEGIESSRAATLLSQADICLRGGLHCSFLAHKKLNTLNTGVVRFAPSVFNSKSEVYALIKKINAISV